MHTPKDCYEILGITREASIEEIERAYESLMSLYLSNDQCKKSKKLRGKRRKLKQVIKAYYYVKRDKFIQLKGGAIHKEELELFKDMALSFYDNNGLDLVNLPSVSIGYINPSYYHNLDSILTFGYLLMKSGIGSEKGYEKVRKR